MANNYAKILELANKNNMGLSNTIKRDYGIPLDYSSVQESYEAALTYAKTNTLAYIGQPISVGDTLYIVTDEANGYLKAVGTKPTGDDKSISVSDTGVISMYGFAAAADATLPRKNSDGTISWITLADIAGSTDTNTKTVVEAADGSDITVSYSYDQATDTKTYTLDVQFPAIPEYTVTKEAGEGQVSYKVTKDGTQVGETIVVPNAYDDTALAGRVATLEGFDHSVYALNEDLDDVKDRLDVIEGEDTVDGSIKKALKDAKAYADGLAGNYDASGAAATAETNAKTYTDEEITGLELAFTDNQIQLTNKAGTVVAEFDASVFVQDSFLDDVKYEDGKIKFTWTMGDGSTKTDEVDVADFVPVYTVAEGSGLTLTNNEFGVNTEIIATKASVDAVQKAIDDYSEAHTNDYTNTDIDTAISDAITELNIGDYAKAAAVVSNETFGTFKTENTAAIAKAVSDQAVIDDGKYATQTNLAGVEAIANAAATKTYVDTELAKKINKDLVYTQGEIDAKIGTPGAPEIPAQGEEGTEDYIPATPAVVGTGIFASTYSRAEVDDLLDKVSGGSSETAASVKRQLDTYKSENDNRVSLIEQKDTTQDTAIKANADAITAINAADTGILAQAKTYADGLKTNIDTAYKAADTALGGRIDNALALINGEGGLQAQVTALDGRVGTAESKVTSLETTVEGHTTDINNHTTAINGLSAEDTRLANLIAGNTTKFESYYDKDTVDDLIEGVEAQITNLGIGDYAKTSDVTDAIEVETNRALQAEQANTDAINALIGEDTGKTIRAIAKAEVATIVGAAPEALDTLEEVATWITNDQTGAAAMANDIATNKAILVGFGGEDQPATVAAAIATAKSEAIEAAKFTLESATTEKLGGIKSATGDNKVTVANDGIASVETINVNTLVQTTGEVIVLNGGSATSVTA